MQDLTVVYYTANHLKEDFANKVRDQLRVASMGFPLISVSQKPMPLFGKNIHVDNLGHSYLNIYKQILTGVLAAKTKYVALVEDDILYSKEHFTSFRPKDDEVGYNMARWNLYTWSKPPVYSWKNRKINGTCIAPRNLLIEALEERFAKYPDESKINLSAWSEIGKYEDKLGVTKRKAVEYVSYVPVIMFSHPQAIGYQYLQDRKKLGFLQAYEIPVWGSAEGVINKYYGRL